MIKKSGINNLIFILLLLALIGFIVYGLIMQVRSINGISPSTKTRTKLETSIPSDTVYLDVSSEWTDDLQYVDQIMSDFAQTTGVIPYLKVTAFDEISDQDTLQKATDALYTELFDDEDHFLVIFAPQTDSGYLAAHVIGSNAQSVMDDEAVTIFYQYLDKYSKEPQCSHSDLFLRAYRDTYQRIMGITNDSVSIIFIILLSALIILLIIFFVRRFTRIFKKKTAPEGEKTG